jgi:FkbM family methyltransferase
VNRRAVKKRWRGLKLGLFVGRSASFQAPRSIRLRGRKTELAFPDERGVNVAFTEIMLGDVYGLESLSQVRTILDVGAHVGFFTLAAHARHPDAVIHSYEPNPALLEFLEENVAQTGAVVHREAVGVTSGQATLVAGAETVNTEIRSADGGDVSVISLRTALERLGGSADLMKLDCEGCEWELFGDPEPWPHIENVSLEYHGSSQDAVEKLTELGYTVRSADTGPYGIVLASRRSG